MSRPVTQSDALFATADIGKIQRSTFIRPSSLKTTFNCGKLVPVYWDEILPGDTFKMDMKFLSRLSTPVFPTMDDINLEFYSFFVPFRLIWKGWVNLHGENTTGPWVPAETPALVPVFGQDNTGSSSGVSTIVASKKIGDYMRIPVGMDMSKYPVSCLPFRAYAMIWNEWFRDENLQAPIALLDGNDEAYSNFTTYGPNGDLFPVNKFHDYFTSALPGPLKGDSPLIPIELNQLIPVITGAEHFKGSADNRAANMFMRTPTGNDVSADGKYKNLAVTSYNYGDSDNPNFIPTVISQGGDPTLSAPYSGLHPTNLWADPIGLRLNSSTITELRTAVQIQRLLERDSRSGTRFRELLLSHFSVDAGDYRLQRPEFLGKYVSRVGIQSVPQTSSTDATSPQGNLAAYSLTTGSSVLCNKSFVEHGILMVFAVARQVKTYQQGLDKFWFKRDRFDFYYPALAHISEQPIYNKELYALANSDSSYTGDEVFGYQEAWADYRFKNNAVTGQMRSGVTNSLDVWHYADLYNTTPALSDGWIQDNSATNVDRTLAVQMSQDDQIRMDIAFVCKATRPMPLKSIPGLMDHF